MTDDDLVEWATAEWGPQPIRWRWVDDVLVIDEDHDGPDE